MESIKKLLKNLGLNDQQITELQDDKLPEGVTVDTLSDQLSTDIGKIYAAKNKPGEEELKTARIIALKDFKRSIGKAVGLQMSNSEFDQIEPAKFIEALTGFVADEVGKVKTGTSETFSKEIEGLKTKVRAQDDIIEGMNKSHKAAIEEAQKAAETKIRGYERSAKVDSVLSGMTFAFGEDIMKLPKQALREQVSGMNYIEVNGKLYEPDGTTPFTVNNKRINSIDEYVTEYMTPYTKKQNGSEKTGVFIPEGATGTAAELASKAAAEYMARNPNQ